MSALGYRKTSDLAATLQKTAFGFVLLWFVAGGIAHFALADTVMTIVPPYIPYAAAVVYVSGFFELLGALGLLVRRTRFAAGMGLVALTVCVTPANVYMWQHANRFVSVPEALLLLRLPFQLVLIGLIVWASRLGRNTQRRLFL